MNRQDILNKIDTIMREECAHIRSELIKAIRRRVRDELPPSVTTHMPSRFEPYPTTAGPKITNFPKCDSSIYCQTFVLPLMNVEVKNDG